MAYKPNPNREIVDGKAKVSAKELAEFQDKYGKDKTLRDLLNADKGLSRKKESEDLPKTTDAKVRMSRQSGPPTMTQDAASSKEEAPKPKAAEKSLLDKYRESDTAKGFRDARATFGDTPSTDMLMKTGQVGMGMGIGRLLGPAGSALGAVVKRALKEDVPESFLAKEKNQSFNPEKMVDRSRSEPAFNPDKMVDRRSTTFPGRSEPKLDLEKIMGRDRPEPMKKGGKVSSVSKRGDGIAQRGKTKGRFI
jgi:hypothetical protein